jgi:hypothetical protein
MHSADCAPLICDGRIREMRERREPTASIHALFSLRSCCFNTCVWAATVVWFAGGCHARRCGCAAGVVSARARSRLLPPLVDTPCSFLSTTTATTTAPTTTTVGHWVCGARGHPARVVHAPGRGGAGGARGGGDEPVPRGVLQLSSRNRRVFTGRQSRELVRRRQWWWWWCWCWWSCWRRFWRRGVGR